MLMSYEFRVVCAAQAEADCFNRTCMRVVPNGEHDGERQPGVPDAVNNTSREWRMVAHANVSYAAVRNNA